MDSGVLRRAAVVGALAALAVALAVLLYQRGPQLAAWWPGCTFDRLTGWHCPGCGMTRAAYALLHFRVAEAFGHNPLLMTVLPVVVAGFGLELLGWVRGPTRNTPRLRPAPRIVIGFVAVILVYWVLRNLPWWPFTWLAP